MENTGYFNIDVGMSYVNSKYYAHLTVKNLLFAPHDLYGDFEYNKNRDTTKNDNRPAPGDKGAKTKPSVHTKKFKQMYGETRKEAYDIGHDYAQHAVSITPGQDGYDPNYQGGSYKPAVLSLIHI